MLISQTAEYALRVMTQLAILQSPGTVSREELARETRIPVHFLAKIMRKLVTARLVTAKRGAGGGVVLAHPLHEIPLADVLEAVGYDFELNRCAFGWARCNNLKPCPLHGVWSRAKESFRNWAEKTTLADIGKG